MKTIRSLAIALFIITFSAYKASNTILDKLEMQQQAVENAILSNLLGVEPRKPNCSGDCDDSRFSLPYKKTALATIVNGDKKAAALEMCDFIKTYCQSNEFNNTYQAERNKHKPINEQPKNADPGYISNLKSTVAEFEKNYNEAKTAQEKELYAPIIAEMRKQYKEASDPTPETTAWQEKYPTTADSLVRKQLRFYLSELATVDFNAPLIAKQTASKTTIQIFANPKYEKEKSETWKYIFRAGKDVNAVVKTFAVEWLKEGK